MLILNHNNNNTENIIIIIMIVTTILILIIILINETTKTRFAPRPGDTWTGNAMEVYSLDGPPPGATRPERGLS